MFKISKWYNNYQSPLVLMIDDLSDAYIDVFKESYENDWGYLCDKNGSAYNFLETKLLNIFPDIKITFFVPYLRHAVINENSKFKFKKFTLGERQEYTDFLKRLDVKGHEIAHHGSDHGQYIDKSIVSTVNNWTHEWALFDTVEAGVKKTLDGVESFKETCGLDIDGGKYCGYISIENSQEIIDKCNFLYWCEKSNLNLNDYEESCFGVNEIFSFPTTFAGNSFVRLSYKTGHKKRDNTKKVLKYFQPFYNIFSYNRLNKLYKEQGIISIQEHISPSTAAGTIQSANIVSDIKSLKKIFSFFSKKSIWYDTCFEISKYFYIRNNSYIEVNEKELNIVFNNKKDLNDTFISVTHDKNFILKNEKNEYQGKLNNKLYVVSVPIIDGSNIFVIKY